MIDLDLPPTAQGKLKQYGFDAELFSDLRDRLRAGRFTTESNRLKEGVDSLNPGDVTDWPSDADAQKLAEAGQAACAAGEVGVVILNGGMATRFGGVVKGVVEVTRRTSFLGFKLGDIAATGADVPVFLMNSFATLVDTEAHLRDHDYFGLPQQRVHMLAQRISLRLTPKGEVFQTANREPSYYAPGHGDLFGVVSASEAFSAFVRNGGKYLLVSNVDNLGATLDPKVIGAHIRSGKKVTIEVADKEPGDKGGAPARVGGRVIIVEGFRFPEEFDVDKIPVFNTNTMVINAEAIRDDYPLTWFRADKKVGDADVVQFERLMGEVTSFVDTQYLRVPRSGGDGRFLPVKTPEDLKNLEETIRTRMQHVADSRPAG